MHPLVAALRAALARAADPEQAPTMQAYMKSALPFRGVPQPVRARILRECLAAAPPPTADVLARVVDALWDGAEFREERYLATALCAHRSLARLPDADWLPRYRHWIVSGAWWDHVDEIANRLVGPLLRADPGRVVPVMRRWATDPDPWLRRASIICQLMAKEATDTALLGEAIEASLKDEDFFLRKGIGWALRQHARTDPLWVREFVDAHPDLSPLSRREALKHL
ncbi:DNA alkylation repair protein [Pseudonocardia sp. WMMC193]|uniref:DNA alkylation repair protein n=1 Tax=Pseudonocardia sp. WMMC193 TaxID=2911965 RepID=UPI001F3526A9|nr:DNA alkylation repair protein [Pseudonocardia sp. WMMC193]MCF7549668.1 DNA alkylation repair protein [Pseudonocardia sp. WMMC193]